MSCVVSGSGSNIVLTTHSGRPALVYLHSVLIHNLCTPYRHLAQGNLSSKSYIGEGKYQKMKQKEGTREKERGREKTETEREREGEIGREKGKTESGR